MANRTLEKILVTVLLLFMAGAGVKLTQNSGPVKAPGAQVSFLDVGQGDATLFRTIQGKYVLVDGGPDKKILTELGAVLPASVHRIDAVILTHPHADHVAGLNYVLDRYDVSDIYLTGATHGAPEYLDFLEGIRSKNISAHKSYRGQVFSIDGMTFSFLYPLSDISGQKPKDQNDGSLVLRVESQGSSILMLGDLSAKMQERDLLSEFAAHPTRILKVSHHGSKTGTTLKTLASIRPEYSIISVGAKNDFGHPAPSILAILSGSRVLRTDKLGRIIFNFRQDGIDLQ
jgi:competence protein ComEC